MVGRIPSIVRPGMLSDFFNIRRSVPLGHRILLGIIPICFILAVWHYLTTGTYHLVTLPLGELGEHSGPEAFAPGTVIPYRSTLTLKGWKLQGDRSTEEDEQSPQLLVRGLHTLPAPPHPFNCRQVGDSVLISLIPEGVIKKVHSMSAEAEAEADVSASESESSSESGSESGSSSGSEPGSAAAPVFVGRGGVRHEPTTTSSLEFFDFYYENISARIYTYGVPSIREVINANKTIWIQRKLGSNLLDSFRRILLGFLVSVIFVFPLSVFMGSFRMGHAMFSPLMVFSGYLPIPAIVQLFVFVLGIGEQQKVVFLAFAFSIYLLPLFVKAIEDVDNVYLLTAYTLGASRFQVVRHALVGICLPHIFDAMRMGFGVGWGYIILAEMFDLSTGAGGMLTTSIRRSFAADVFLIIIVIVSLAFITDKLWEMIGHWLFPYRSLKR